MERLQKEKDKSKSNSQTENSIGKNKDTKKGNLKINK